VADVISFGPEEPRRVPRWVVVAGILAGVALLVGALVAVGTRGRPVAGPRVPAVTGPIGTTGPTGADPTAPACLPVGWGQQPAVSGSVAGLRIDGTPTRGGLDRCDRTVAGGPWTVVVRRPDGSLGRRGAVVTFPAEPSVGGRGVAVGGVTGSAATGSVTWPVGGGHARVRGDLAEADLVAIAARTRVEAGRPAVDPPAGLAVVTTGPYRAPSVHETRFGSASVGESAALGDGLTFTGVTSGGGYEDVMYTRTTRDGGPVGGRPAVVSDAFGGNGTIAWEPAPGLVAYIGYSGSLMDDAAVAALRRLADRARPMTAAQWAEAGANVTDQTNTPG
jgi:hypothetical protein